jgi:hypothetical protein
MSMPDAPSGSPSFLRKKIAGVPALYWLAGLAIVFGYLGFQSLRLPKETEAVSPAETAAEPAAESDTAILPDMPRGTVVVSPAPAPAPDNASISTNAEWLRRGVAQLIAAGRGPGEAQGALSAYLDGADLSYDQGVMRDAAVRELGLPPYPASVGRTGSAPAKRQGPLPRTHVVKNVSEDSYAELANLYYGSASSTIMSLIRGAAQNKGIVKETELDIGTEVYLPAVPVVSTVKRVANPLYVNLPFRTYIRLNSTGSTVSAVQRSLGRPVTGKFSAADVAALKAKQKALGLTPDGVVGPTTWAKLQPRGPK